MIEDPGLPATIGLALLVSVSAWAVHACVRACASGQIPANGIVGLRLRALTRSEGAWRTGHGAATQWTRRMAIGVSVVLAVSCAAHALPTLYLVLLGAGVLLLPVGTIVAAVTALRAANSMTQQNMAEADTSG